MKTVTATALLLLATKIVAAPADTPVTPNAAPETRSLLAFFHDIYGKKIISGQEEGWQQTNGLSLELNYLTNVTGKLPALIALDLSGCTGPSPQRDTSHRLARRAIQWVSERPGIVSFCCHWRAPMAEPAFYTQETSFAISRAVTAGTPEYAAMERDLDALAAELEILRAARVPVLWRPLHEANGRWFWWGAGGPEPFKKLWRLMFENFTVKHHLNNLLWVFSPGAETDLAAWYPGDAYVDIVGADHYPLDGNHEPAKDIFDELTTLTRGQKFIALGENGPVPAAALMEKEKAGWLFFTTWSGGILFEKTTPEQLRADYNHPCVLTLADLPDLKKYPFKPAGKAVKLSFLGAPGGVAINGTWRMPVTVAVEDAGGQIVRDGNDSVTLALKNSGGATLSGALTADTMNGIATFPDVKIDAPIAHCQFIAKANGLQPATSADFSVGPGNGLLRESWTDGNSAAGAREILGSALETPVAQATNFSARIRGELLPPQTGDYRFSVAGGGEIQLWLGTNDSPASAAKLLTVTGATPYRKWPHINEADSPGIKLAAGRKYYFEIRQRQERGSTQLHARWRLPDGSEERPIPAFRFERRTNEAD
jgi:hypothetical protein